MLSLDTAKFENEMTQIENDQKNIARIVSEIETETNNMIQNGLNAPEAAGLSESLKVKAAEMLTKTDEIKAETKAAFATASENILRASATNSRNVPY
jgi:hypothetical protein